MAVVILGQVLRFGAKNFIKNNSHHAKQMIFFGYFIIYFVVCFTFFIYTPTINHIYRKYINKE